MKGLGLGLGNSPYLVHKGSKLNPSPPVPDGEILTNEEGDYILTNETGEVIILNGYDSDYALQSNTDESIVTNETQELIILN